MKGRVIIFSITGCPFCMRANDKMQKLGIDYIDINLDNYPERRAEAKERSGRNTVPQIFFNNRHIGGFDDFDKLTEAELQELIKEVEENPAPADAPQPPSPGDSGNEECRFTRQRLPTAAARAKKNARAREKIMHALARKSPYPESNQQRYPVPDFLVDWQESFPGYDPPLYTAQDRRASPAGADPDILHPSNTSVVINFNCLDEGINRRSHTGVIDVVNQLPRNPVGRTGIAGRGLLARWGPNHATHIVATRWKIGEDGLIVQKQDKNVLEFVAVKSPQSLKWAMPGGLMEVGESVSSSLRRILTKKVLVAVKPAIAEKIGNLGQRVDAIIQNATEVYTGYMDTLRNTDNAWMETATLHFHDETREILGDIEFEVKDGAPIINWQEVSGQINLRASHSFILHKVAESWNANF